MEWLDEEVIAGRVCVKCSLIESKEGLALLRTALLGGDGSGSGGMGQAFLTIVPQFGKEELESEL